MEWSTHLLDRQKIEKKLPEATSIRLGLAYSYVKLFESIFLKVSK
jgi:hypothetical protein